MAATGKLWRCLSNGCRLRRWLMFLRGVVCMLFLSAWPWEGWGVESQRTAACPICLGSGSCRCSKHCSLPSCKSKRAGESEEQQQANSKKRNQQSRSFQIAVMQRTTNRHARATPTQKQTRIFWGAPSMNSRGAKTALRPCTVKIELR